MYKVKNLLQKGKRVLKILSLGAAVTYGTLHIPYVINTAKNDLMPSQQRQAFEERYGMDLEGWNSDLEMNKRNIANIADVIEKEMRGKPFKVNTLIVRSKNPMLNKVNDHFTRYFFPHTGYYNPIFNDVLIEPKSYATLHHEIKHLKTFEALETHPEFKREWERLVKGPDRRSLYLGVSREAFYRFRFTNSLVGLPSPDDLFQQGFVSEYASTNFYEDVAETGEFVEDDNTYRIEGLRKLNYNGVLDEKIKLLEKYGIIASEYSEHARLNNMFRATISGGGHGSWSIDLPKVFDFMQESREFLKKNKGSIYEEKIRINRAIAMRRASVTWKPNEKLPKGDLQNKPDYWHYAVTPEDAIDEFIQTLESDFHGEYYAVALDNLKDLYFNIGQWDKSNIMLDAYYKYMKRIDDGYIGLPSIGVNDFLKEKGILK